MGEAGQHTDAGRAPQAYEGFEGTVGRIFATSEPSWPVPPVAPAGAPNVIVVLADDLGWADLGCFGSEIDTPNIDRLAAEGLRYTSFHSNPMCSPTRASLLTGLNHHLAGVGYVAHADPGFPGYAMELRDDTATMAEIMRDRGWATLMVGKWHLCKDTHASDAGPRHSWPLQRGFDRFYGILDGFTNFHQPHRLYEDNHVVDVDRYPDDYYFTDDITDRAIKMVRELRSSHPTKPFFMYFSHGAVHAPLQAKAQDLEKYRGAYAAGWDEIRERRFRRQVETGLLPEGTVLPPRNSEPDLDVTPWEELTDVQRELFARYQEIFAAMVDSVDQSLGHLRAALEELGEWDNTIVVFTSDNGGSREGLANGTSAYFRTLSAQHIDTGLEDVDVDHARLELLGGPQALAHYPRGWAMVSNTPWRLYKISAHQGGHQVPFVVSWPRGLSPELSGGLRRQYQHVTDLLPTLAELAGFDVPTHRQGRPSPERSGASFASSFTAPGAASTHTEQYYEMCGNRGFYRAGWSVSISRQPRTPFSEERWELHDLDSDPTESRDLASVHPDTAAELGAAWEAAAWANQVFPLDEGSALKHVLRPPWDDRLSEPCTIVAGTPTLERYRSLALVNFRSFTVEIALAEPGWQLGDEGILVAHGDQGGGYAVYVERQHLRYVHNGYGEMRDVECVAMPRGATRIELVMHSPGGFVWHAELSVDGGPSTRVDDLRTLTAMAPFEGIDVGCDRRSPVSWDLFERHGTFPYTGALRSVTYLPGELAPDAATRWLDYLREAGIRYE